MSRKETLPLIVALLTTALLLGAGGWWLSKRLANFGASGQGVSGPEASKTGNPLGDSAQIATGLIANRLSSGERLLIPATETAAQAQKVAGIQALATQDYAKAIPALEAALKERRNDPESLIYLNNARIDSQSALTIAVAVPIDQNIDAALEILRGVAQAQTEYNQSGASKLRILIANDGGSPEIARQIAAALAANAAVLGVVGHYSSDMSLAAAEVYTQNKLVMISPVSTSVKLSNLSPYVFRTVPSDFLAARSLANHMVTRLKQQQAAVFFNSQSAYSQSLKSEFVSALSLAGGQVVSEVDLSNANFDAASRLRQAQELGATVLALLPDSSQLDRSLQLVQLNQRRLKLLGGDSVYSPKTLSVAGAAAQGISIAVPWHILANQDASFVKLSRQLWGGDINWRTATAYDAALALIGAATNTTPATRASVQAALASPDFSVSNGAGSVKFLPSGDRNQAIQLVTVKSGQRSGQGYDFVPLP